MTPTIPSQQIRRDLPDQVATARLVLRRPDDRDAASLQRLANNYDVHRMLARLPHPYTMEHAFEFIHTLSRSETEHAYAITRDEALVGVIGFHFFELDGRDSIEIGYWLGEPYWGKGYASEAAAALISALFDVAPDAPLMARALADNSASCRVLEKAGFRLISETVDDCGPHEGRLIRRFDWQGGGQYERTGT
ncbi:MAG: GNAT family N-acetyltransferase [Hyphomicrobiaceae bacterium]|nr:GNAT family N-acetyltransferase [Hyphomicrobiaceae bacterium]MCC0024388.1 GNAT family N-acetyltransferase [Hyphomicrobiaceae bacterium]